MIILFEQYNEEPQIGHYVFCEEEDTNDGNDASREVKMFIKNNIGVIMGKLYDKNIRYPYIIHYKHIPTNIKNDFEVIGYDNCRTFRKEEIKKFSTNKKDCEVYIQANKYNL